MENEQIANRKGIGNQNARKHGYYSSVLTEEEQQEYERAMLIDGFDDEIALLRVKIKSLVDNNPENVRLITLALNTLTRMVMSKNNVEPARKETVADTITNILKGVALPAGIGIATLLKK